MELFFYYGETMKQLSLYLTILLLISLLVVNHYRNAYLSLVSELKEKELHSQVKQTEKEKEYAYTVIQAKDFVKSDIQDVDQNYNRIITNFDIKPTNDSVYNRKGSRKMSSIATVTTRISEDRSKQLKQCRANFKRLEQEYLILAKDADITTVHYNNLIDLYNRLSNNNTR